MCHHIAYLKNNYDIFSFYECIYLHVSLCISVFLCMMMGACAFECRCLHWPKEDTGSPRFELKVHCELPDLSSRNKTVTCQSNMHSLPFKLPLQLQNPSEYSFKSLDRQKQHQPTDCQFTQPYNSVRSPSSKHMGLSSSLSCLTSELHGY